MTAKTKAKQAEDETITTPPPEETDDETTSVDADDQELEAAMAALKDEESDEDKAEPDKDDKADKDEKEEPDEGDEPEAATPMIPKPQFDKKIAAIADLEAKNTFLEARVKAFEKIVQSSTATTEQKEGAAAAVVDAAEDKREAIAQKVIDAAERYDENEISMREFKTIEMQAERELSQLERSGLLQEIARQTPKQEDGLDLYSSQLIEMLETQHPYAALIENYETDPRGQMLIHEAVSQLRGEGVALRQNRHSDMLVRTRVAELTDTFGPIWFPDANVKTPEKGSQSENPATTGDAARHAAMKDREKKLDLASKFPPDTKGMGNAGTSDSMPSDVKLESMTDDEIAELPPAVRRKLLNQA